MERKKKVVVAQGGGPTNVINQSLVGVILESRKSPKISSVYGAIKGVEGIVNENFLDLTQETSHNLEQVASTPSAALLSSRDKPDKKYCQEILKVFKAHNVGYFFYIGGNDSADTVRIINENAQELNYALRTIHIPKTIDNDIVLNDHTPGYGSAAKFVIQAFSGINLDNRSLPGVHIIIVMGRHSGFLTASSSLAKVLPDDGPHLIYMPERTFYSNLFLKDVKKVYDKYGRCLVAVSEGIIDENKTPILCNIISGISKDPHGNIELSSNNSLLGDYLAGLVKRNLNIQRVRLDTLGYFQRSFNGCVSDVDQFEAREVGEKAVQFAVSQNASGSVVIERIGDYSVDYTLKSLNAIARKTKVMPDKFINSFGNNVTEAFKFYCRPLLGSGFPSTYGLKAPVVKKLLKNPHNHAGFNTAD